MSGTSINRNRVERVGVWTGLKYGSGKSRLYRHKALTQNPGDASGVRREKWIRWRGKDVC